MVPAQLTAKDCLRANRGGRIHPCALTSATLPQTEAATASYLRYSQPRGSARPASNRNWTDEIRFDGRPAAGGFHLRCCCGGTGRSRAESFGAFVSDQPLAD